MGPPNVASSQRAGADKSIAARRERAAPAVAATTPAPTGASAEEFDEIPSAKRPCYEAAATGSSGPVSGLKIPNFQWPHTQYCCEACQDADYERHLSDQDFPCPGPTIAGRCAEGSTAREMIENLVKTVEDRMSDGRVSIEEIDALTGWYNSNDVLAMENAKQIDLLANLRADMVTAKSYDSDSDCDEEGAAYDETGQDFIC